MRITLEVLKLLKFNDFNEKQLENDYIIQVTPDVSNISKSNDINDEQL